VPHIVDKAPSLVEIGAHLCGCGSLGLIHLVHGSIAITKQVRANQFHVGLIAFSHIAL